MQTRRPSRKGTYLAVMAAVAFLFIVYLFVIPTFINGDHPTPPPLLFGGVLIVVALLFGVVWVWRQQMKRKPLDRKEGLVSGQIDNVIKS